MLSSWHGFQLLPKIPIILGPFSLSLQLQLKGKPKFIETCDKNNIIVLLKLIRDFCCKHEQSANKVYALMKSLRALIINFQKYNVSNDDYLKEFQTRVATLNDYNVNMLDMVPCLLEDDVKEKYNKEVKYATKVELKTARENV